MKLVVIRSEMDEFEKAKELLARDLTPRERTWLILADVLLRKVDQCGFVSTTGHKAA